MRFETALSYRWAQLWMKTDERLHAWSSDIYEYHASLSKAASFFHVNIRRLNLCILAGLVIGLQTACMSCCSNSSLKLLPLISFALVFHRTIGLSKHRLSTKDPPTEPISVTPVLSFCKHLHPSTFSVSSPFPMLYHQPNLSTKLLSAQTLYANPSGVVSTFKAHCLSLQLGRSWWSTDHAWDISLE